MRAFHWVRVLRSFLYASEARTDLLGVSSPELAATSFDAPFRLDFISFAPSLSASIVASLWGADRPRRVPGTVVRIAAPAMETSICARLSVVVLLPHAVRGGPSTYPAFFRICPKFGGNRRSYIVKKITKRALMLGFSHGRVAGCFPARSRRFLLPFMPAPAARRSWSAPRPMSPARRPSAFPVRPASSGRRHRALRD